jgi:cytochrome c553
LNGGGARVARSECSNARGAPRRARSARSALVTLACAAVAMTAQAAPKVEDTMAQRMQACTGCHGAQGRAASDGYHPRIAGKPAGYLYQQLLAFRDGRRHYALMTNLLAPLSDDYLRAIAEHFAGLDLPYPPPQAATAGADVLARGEALVRRGDAALNIPACAQCHGAALMGVAPMVMPMGVMPAVPAVLGMPRDYLNAQLGAWRTGSRHAAAPDCMAQVARQLAPADIAALSQWLAAQPVPAGAKPAAAMSAPMPLRCGGAADGPAR